MSISALPEWKQLLLERKRRDEEERERREREEEEKLARIPAWKREIIQRRKAKQDEEREKGGGHLPDISALIDEVIVAEQKDPGTPNQSSKETLSSIRQNPFIRSENSFRRDNREKKTNNNTGRGRTVETEKETSEEKEREFWKDQGMRIERTENTHERKEKDTNARSEKMKKCGEMDSITSLLSPVTGLHTIKAKNIIIIEKEKNNKERPEWKESPREDVHREKKRMRMDLREFLVGGGSVTEIRASEVLIIKPPVTEAEIPEVQERASSRERVVREKIWRREREMDTNHENEIECGGRVSQLLSKFGEVPKPPVRSKSTDCFDRCGKNRSRYSTGDLHVQEDEDAKTTFRCVPKRSFSFSDRVVCHQENGVCEEELEFKVVERTYSDRRVSGADRSRSEPGVTRRWRRQKCDNEGVFCREADGEKGFTVASVKIPESVAFARRVQIKRESWEAISDGENRRASEKKQVTVEGQEETETWKQDELKVLTALKQSHNPLNNNSAIDSQCQVSSPSEDDSRQPDLLSQQTETNQEFNRTSQTFSHGDGTCGEMNQHTPDMLQISGQTGTCAHEEVTIPTNVFYGADVSARKTGTGDGAGVERMGSWKTGRPLTRVESLRERIRQQEEKKKAMDGTETERAEATAIKQEENTPQALKLFDVTQEVTMASPQLPVPSSLLHLQSEREVGEISRDECEGETERELDHHVEECETRSLWRRQDIDIRDKETARVLLEEEYLPPSLSPSPPLPVRLDEMSRIYNLKAVSSRSGVCIGERKAEISRGSQGKYTIITAQSPDILPPTAKLWTCGTAKDDDKTETVESGVQTVQHQVERLQLKEQEEGCGSQNDKETLLKKQEVKTAEGQKRPDLLKETSISQTRTHPRFPLKSHPKPQQLKSLTINARNAQPTESTSRSPEQGNCPSSSPSSTTSTPPLFSIRSASGGAAGKRGTTITITPRRSGVVTPSTETPSRAGPQGQTPAAITRETNKKRYPTAEEIEVIGGYQNLERSCLVKSRGTPKAVKVCFDDIQLEKVCEYPSQDCSPESLCGPPEPGSEDERCGGEQEDDEEEENTSRGDISSVNAGRLPFLKVDESSKR